MVRVPPLVAKVTPRPAQAGITVRRHDHWQQVESGGAERGGWDLAYAGRVFINVASSPANESCQA
jgi:hypothetical protein